MVRKALVAAVAVLLAGTANAAVTEFIIYKQENFRGASQTVKGEVANLEGGFAGEGSSLIVRGGNWEVCTRHHFQGNCYVIGPGEYPTLGRELSDRIVAVRFVGEGKVATVRQTEERRESRSDRREERRDDRRDERRDRREGGASVDLYGGQDFRGRSVRIEANTPDLSHERFDGRASSVIVHEGTWQLCSEPRFSGTCAVFRPGKYPHLAGLDDRVVSLRQLR